MRRSVRLEVAALVMNMRRAFCVLIMKLGGSVHGLMLKSLKGSAVLEGLSECDGEEGRRRDAERSLCDVRVIGW